jgi:hypothetical protein
MIRKILPRSLAVGLLISLLTTWSLPAQPAGAPALEPISEEALALMQEAIQDEYRSHTIYQQVVADFGEVLPFLHTMEAELRHAAALERLYRQRSLVPPAPAAAVTEGPVRRYESVLAACTDSVQTEVDNVAIYDRLLALELPPDVRRVAEFNREASQERHLPAYQRCVDGGGQYTMGQGCRHGQGRMKGAGAGRGMGPRDGTAPRAGMGPGPGMGTGTGMGRGPGMAQGKMDGSGPGAGPGQGGRCANCPMKAASSAPTAAGDTSAPEENPPDA